MSDHPQIHSIYAIEAEWLKLASSTIIEYMWSLRAAY